MQHATVADVMTTSVVSVSPETPFAEIADVLFTNAVRAVPVLDESGRLLGVISEADLLVTAERGEPEPERPWWRRRPRHISRSAAPAGKAGASTARELMTTSVVTVSPEATVARAARLMRERGLSWLPVVDAHGAVVGVLGRSDLLRVFLRDDAAIKAEVVDDVFGRVLLVDPGRVSVEVADGVVTLEGELETRADAVVAVRFVERLDGVVGVVDRLRFRIDERLDDSRVAPLW
jgi:CBS-domain-containing membrane protein